MNHQAVFSPDLRARRRIVIGILLVVITALALAFYQVEPGGAAQLVVNTAVDEYDGSCSDGDCSLRDAIALAASGDRIIFAGDYSVYLNYRLPINKTLTIDGSGRAITLSGDTNNDGSPNVRVFNIFSAAVVTLTHLSIVDGLDLYGGGGIYNTGTLLVQGSTFKRNQGEQGCALENNGKATLENNTFSGNPFLVGVVYNSPSGVMTMTHNTLTDNPSDASLLPGQLINDGILKLRNTLIANSSAEDCYNNYHGGTISLAENNLLKGAGEYACGLVNGVNGNIIGFDPNLAALADNGGETQTHALQPGSLAIDAANDAACLPTDQRGVTRPQGAHCDIGAYEKAVAPYFSLVKTVTPAEAAPGDLVTYTLQVAYSGVDLATGVVITDILPAELTHITYSSRGLVITPTASTPYIWQVQDLAPGTSGEIVIHGQVSDAFFDGVVENTAQIASASPDLSSASSASLSVRSLALSKTVDNARPAPGEQITFTLVLSNLGSANLTQVALTDTLPAGLTFAGPVIIEGGSGVAADDPSDLPLLASQMTLPAHQSLTVTFPVTVNASLVHGASFANTAYADSAQTGPTPQVSANIIVTTCRVRLNDNPTEYYDLQQALDAAAVGDMVKVSGVCNTMHTVSGYSQVGYINKTLTLRGGYERTFAIWDPAAYPTRLDGRGAGRVLYVAGSGSPTLEYLILTGGDAAKGGSPYVNSYGGGAFVQDAAATFDHCTFSGNRADLGGGFFLRACACELVDLVVQDNTATYYGGGGYLYYSPASISNSLFTHNAARHGGGLYTFYAEATLSNNTLQANTASHNGGGAVLSKSSLTLRDNIVKSNVVGCYGGGLYLYYGSQTVLGGEIAENEASFSGGGLFLYYSTAVVSNTQVLSNTAATYGGGAFLLGESPHMRNNRLRNNTAGSGAGAYLWQTQATLSGNIIQANTASEYGGGLYAGYGSPSLSQNQATGNTARSGGGMLFYYSRPTLQGNALSDNQVGFYGGGVYLRSSQAALNHNLLYANTAQESGGGAYVYASAPTWQGDQLYGNAADFYGGGLVLSQSPARLFNLVIAANQAGQRAGGLYIFNASPRLWHLTLADNVGAQGLYIGDNGLPSQPVMTNTLISGHGLGLYLANNTTLNLAGALWNNTADWQQTAAAAFTHAGDVWGSPFFANPALSDYHIEDASAARNAGVASEAAFDMDGEARPQEGAYDLGADEYTPSGLALLSQRLPLHAAVLPHMKARPWAPGGDPEPALFAQDLALLDSQFTRHNTPPQAQDDEFTVQAGASVLLDVLSNDSDMESALSITAVSQPLHGTLAVLGSRLVYTPAPGFVGADSFTYTVSDGNLSSTALVTAVVAPKVMLSIYIPLINR